MAKWREHKEQHESNEEVGIDPKCPMFDHNPNLLECLAGFEIKPGVLRKGCKLSLWIDGKHVKFAINDEEVDEVGFGTLNTDLKLSGALEHVIENGLIEWKEKKPYKSGGRQ